MSLNGLLRERKSSIIRRWVEVVLTTYPERSGALFRLQRDRFANPVGHSVRTGTAGIFEALLDQAEPERIDQALRDIISVRAVQEFVPSVAVGFVLRLKSVIRAELAEKIDDPRLAPELARFESQIDRVALMAFDVFMECRERVSQLRVGEMRRRMGWIAGGAPTARPEPGRELEPEPASGPNPSGADVDGRRLE